MSRLLVSDIDPIKKRLKQYDALFKEQTGYTMEETAKRAVALSNTIIKKKTAFVTITSGLGVISGFAKAEEAIISYCGIETKVMEKTDVAGLQEAYQSDCEIAFMADDNVCSAFGIGSRVASDNGWTTGTGFAEALIEAMVKKGINPKDQQILIIGVGPVGTAAAQYLSEQQCIPILCDLDLDKAIKKAECIKNAQYCETPAPCQDFTYILDASTAGGFITEKDVHSDTIIAAPGMPCAVTEKAQRKATVIHNPLELGVMTMYFDCIKQSGE